MPASLPEVFARAWATVMRPDSGTVQVGLATVDAWLPWQAQAQALLAHDERERVERLRRRQDREARTLAYALHRLALAATLRLEAAEVPLYRDELGCPRLHGAVTHTSLSHCDGAIAWVIGHDGPVGIDLEPASRRALMPDIAARVCHPEETRALAMLTAADRNAALLALWVRKEAVLKAAGIGMAVEMECFSCDTGWLDARPEMPLRTHVRALKIGPDWAAAVATSNAAPATIGWLRP